MEGSQTPRMRNRHLGKMGIGMMVSRRTTFGPVLVSFAGLPHATAMVVIPMQILEGQQETLVQVRGASHLNHQRNVCIFFANLTGVYTHGQLERNMMSSERTARERAWARLSGQVCQFFSTAVFVVWRRVQVKMLFIQHFLGNIPSILPD